MYFECLHPLLDAQLLYMVPRRCGMSDNWGKSSFRSLLWLTSGWVMLSSTSLTVFHDPTVRWVLGEELVSHPNRSPHLMFHNQSLRLVLTSTSWDSTKDLTGRSKVVHLQKRKTLHNMLVTNGQSKTFVHSTFDFLIQFVKLVSFNKTDPCEIFYCLILLPVIKSYSPWFFSF